MTGCGVYDGFDTLIGSKGDDTPGVGGQDDDLPGRSGQGPLRSSEHR